MIELDDLKLGCWCVICRLEWYLLIELDDLKVGCESVICKWGQNLLIELDDLGVYCESMYLEKVFLGKYMWEQCWMIEENFFEVEVV